ncbi:UDP-glucose 6-dehydrogenase [Candidatus Gracilibacteria bacterium]|nr:MAG: UDP-glucose 6-dehydrogenase [Candidatus Gracilibacteria bacterium]PIE85602.1 MAG: UDP-glucose 6-dehydrogenase [Candidatus Gracilibacteria bacterium]
MKITIFGTGYVGLVTGTCLAEMGHDVMCVDINKEKISGLNKGIIPIYELGLKDLIDRNFKERRLRFSTNSKSGINFGKVVFNAVGTPQDKNHKADLKFVKMVAKTFGENIKSYKVFVNKSTVPVGTGDLCENIINEEIKKRGIEVKFDVVSNPEFLKEGVAIRDFMLPNRIICGTNSKKAMKIMRAVYEPFVRTFSPLIFTDRRSAEIIKYAANAFLATKISFINEIANFAELAGGNISEISKGIGLDTRIGSRFIHAGVGYGGSCFPKDINALIETGKEYNYNFEIIKATEKVNKKQKFIGYNKLLKHIPNLKGKTITIWGLSFKPKTDDIRDAPSISVIEKLIESKVGSIKLFDPVASNNMKKRFRDESTISFYDNNYDSCNNSDALIILTEWDEFRMSSLKKVKNLMRGNIIIDGRNIWNKAKIEKMGFVYEGIGK